MFSYKDYHKGAYQMLVLKRWGRRRFQLNSWFMLFCALVSYGAREIGEVWKDIQTCS